LNQRSHGLQKATRGCLSRYWERKSKSHERLWPGGSNRCLKVPADFAETGLKIENRAVTKGK
jgi:hypothetical protein